MPTPKFLFVPLVLLLATLVSAQTAATAAPAISSAQPATARGMQPGMAAPVAQPAPTPMVKPVTPVTRKSQNASPPNVHLQVPMPQRALIRRIAMVNIPGRPGFNDLLFLNGCLVMAHPAASTVEVFHVRKRRLIAQIKDMKGAGGLAADQAGRVFVANSDAQEIAVISAKDWKLEKRIALKSAPDALLYVPDTGMLYASNWRDQSVSMVDAKQGAVLNTVVVGGRPEALAYDPASRQIYVTLEDLRQVAVLDATLKLLKRYPLVASMPTGLALDSKARRLYVAVRSAVLELDADSGREIRRVAAPDGIDMLWLDQAGGALYGASSDGTVSLFKVGNGVFEAEREYSTQIHGHTLAFDPASKTLYLPGGLDGRAKLLILRRVEPGPPTLTNEAMTK